MFARFRISHQTMNRHFVSSAVGDWGNCQVFYKCKWVCEGTGCVEKNGCIFCSLATYDPHATNHAVTIAACSGTHWKTTLEQLWIVEVKEAESKGGGVLLIGRKGFWAYLTEWAFAPAGTKHRWIFVMLVHPHCCTSPEAVDTSLYLEQGCQILSTHCGPHTASFEL